MKKLGVIGGLGPMATAYFLQLITQMTDAATDQEHMEILLHSKPSIPDRTRFILGQSAENPVSDMIAVGRELSRQGAELLAIPCITAHYFHEELEREIGLPVIHAIRETAVYLKDRGVERVGILATDGTIRSELFQREFEKCGLAVCVPDDAGQRRVMRIIYEQIKAGEKGDLIRLDEVGADLRDLGAQVNLLACTELSLLKKEFTLSAGYLDVMEVLARRAVKECGRCRGEYERLITE